MKFSTKSISLVTLATLLVSVSALAQSKGNHSNHDMSQMDHSQMKHGEMSHDDMMNARNQHMIEATGTVKKVNKKTGIVTISHGNIPAISWPAMTMKFPVGQQINLSEFKKGQQVQFTLHRAADGTLPLVELCETQSQGAIAGLCAPGMNHSPQDVKPAHKDHSHTGH
jgi:Cu/Ag efflux protein CusF